MRVLHTADWHLGRQIRGISRQPEFEAMMDELVQIARDQAVDLFVIAGDIFDTFSPPSEAERLFYETLTRLLAERIQVVMIAGNHDHGGHMDAPAGILRLANVHCVGNVPLDEGYKPLRLASRDGSEELAVVALPWVPERLAFSFETLAGPLNESAQQYAGKLEQAIRYYWKTSQPDSMRMLVGHMMVDGAVVQDGGGERKLHVGQTFAVQPQSLPADAQYIALGHLHKRQQISTVAPAYYSGSLLQLDFGESGQEKYVNVVEMKPRQPAQVDKVALKAGRKLRTVSLTLDQVRERADEYGDDYLRVAIELERPVMNLYQQVREFLTNAVEVTAKLPQQAQLVPEAESVALSPDQLFERYYKRRYANEAPAPLLKLFNELHSEVLSNE